MQISKYRIESKAPRNREAQSCSLSDRLPESPATIICKVAWPLIPITSQDLPASLAQAYVLMELEREGLIYRILANPFISGPVENKIVYKGCQIPPA
jgi:hypothetical protein